VTVKTILTFDQAEGAGGSIARAIDLAKEMQDFKFIFITYHPLATLYNSELTSNITAKHVFSFYNYQKKQAHIELLRRKTSDTLLTHIGLKLIALADFINETSVLVQSLVKTYGYKVDLIQANGGVHFLPYRLAAVKNAPLIYYFRHLDDYRWAAGKMLDRASEFVFVGANLKQRHMELLKLREDKCHLVHSPFDSQKAFAKTPEHDLEFLYELKRKGYFVILQAARVCHEKGQHISVDALIKLKNSHPRIALIIAGTFERNDTQHYQQLLRGKIQAHQLEDRVLLIGQRDDVLRLLTIADMALQAPLWFESLSGALIEAMQMGVLTVSADMGGAPEAIKHNKTGLLFPAGDSTVLAQLIVQVIEKKIDAAQIAKAGQQHAYAEWKSSVIQQQMRAIYLHAFAEFANRKNKRGRKHAKKEV
jgi:glycosyltransferase involved in cell wall biosynthesis